VNRFLHDAVWVSIASLLMIAGFATSLKSTAQVPAALDPIAGSGQIAVIGQAYPVPLRARVSDGTGAPIAGITVHFDVDQCVSIPEGSACPPLSEYPAFAASSYSTTAITDATGEVAAPALTAGDSEGYFQVVATVYGSDPGGGILAHAYFPLRQVASLAAVPITAAFTGAWYDPAQSGHGLLIEVLPGDRLLAYWFAFTPDAQQAWFGGVGAIVGNQALIYAGRGQGGRWIPSFDPAHYTLEQWGTLTITFVDCNHGRVDFYGAGNSSMWSSGFMELTRLAQPAGLVCE
jgi:hypothetical protein